MRPEVPLGSPWAPIVSAFLKFPSLSSLRCVGAFALGAVLSSAIACSSNQETPAWVLDTLRSAEARKVKESVYVARCYESGRNLLHAVERRDSPFVVVESLMVLGRAYPPAFSESPKCF